MDLQNLEIRFSVSKILKNSRSIPPHVFIFDRAVTKALINWGRGGGYSYIRVLPDLLSLQLISKEIPRAEREYMNMHLPINALVTALIFESVPPHFRTDCRS